MKTSEKKFDEFEELVLELDRARILFAEEEEEEEARIVVSIKDITERKRAEEALQVRSQIIDAAIDSIFIHDFDGNILYVNESAAKTRGYTRDEMIGMNLSQLDIPEFAPLSQPRIKDLLKTRHARFDSVHRCKDGSLMSISIQAQLIKYQGRTAVLGTVRDITESKRTEEALLIIKKAVESASDAIGMSDPQGHHFYQNKSFTNLFEYTAEELEAAGGGQVAFSSSDTAREVFDAIMNGRSWSGETEMISKSGRRFPVLLRADAIKDDIGRIISVLGTFTDITERKRAEDTLVESEERYRTLTEKTIACIYLVQDGLFKYVNPTFCRIHGYTQDELVDKFGPLDLVVEEEKEFLNDKIQQSLSGEKESEQFPIRIRRKDGEIRFLEVFSSYALYAGKPAVLGTCIDVTETRKASETIKKSREELRTLTTYLQNVREEERIRIAREIHDELGQLLTGIKIDISWLKKKLADTVKPTDPIQAKIDSLLGLTDSVIATTRELSLSLRPGILDDLGLVAAINWEMKRFQEKTGIICTLESAMAEIAIPEDYTTALFRICQECLTNIIRYAHATEVNITLTEKGGNIVFTIEDNGKGIKTENIRSPLSLGILGMRERIVSLRGMFSIRGAPGKGTKVRVEVPVK